MISRISSQLTGRTPNVFLLKISGPFKSAESRTSAYSVGSRLIHGRSAQSRHSASLDAIIKSYFRRKITAIKDYGNQPFNPRNIVHLSSVLVVAMLTCSAGLEIYRRHEASEELRRLKRMNDTFNAVFLN